MHKYLPVILLAIYALPTTAQLPSYTLPAVTVTATNSNQKPSITGRNIVTIPGSLIQQLAVNSIDELLRYTAGIESQQRGIQGAQNDLLIRGGTFQQVLVLIDGVRLNDGLTGHFNSNIPIHPNEIDHIEILKGPASAVWGADAVGGVIHILTKAFVQKQNKNTQKVQLGVQLGAYNQTNTNAYASKQQGKLYGAIGAYSNTATGNQLRGTTNYYKLHTVQASGSVLLGNHWSMALKSAVDYRSFNAQNYYTTFKSDTASETVNSFFNHIQLKRTSTKSSFTTDLSYKTLSDEFQYNPSNIPNLNKTKQLLLQANYVGTIDANTEYITGIQLAQRRIASNDRGNHSTFTTGVWFMLKHVLPNHLYLNESIRVDNNPNYGTVLTPQVNIAYNPSKYTIRASYAQGIRDADFTERYNNYCKAIVTGGRIGNPNLKAENTWNLELGADYAPNVSTKISTTAFYRKQSNMIDYVSTPYALMPRKVNLVPTGSYALALNIANVRTHGAELDVMHSKQLSSISNLLTTCNLTYVVSNTGSATPSLYISAHATWVGNIAVVYTIKQWNIALNGVYKARPTQVASAIDATISKDYFMANTKINYVVKKYNTALYLQVHNMLNRNYTDVLGAILPGRIWSGGLLMQLSK